MQEFDNLIRHCVQQFNSIPFAPIVICRNVGDLVRIIVIIV